MLKFAKTKRRSGNKLDAILWKWFSKYIRLRDSFDGINCRCITCNCVRPITEMDAGHFISRNHLTTKFDDRNVHAQCQRCNRFCTGEQFNHGVEIDRRYGVGTAILLQGLSRVRSKFDSLWYTSKIIEYKAKVKELKGKT